MKLRKRLLLMIMVICLLPLASVPSVQAEAASNNWKSVYTRFLKKHTRGKNYYGKYYNRFHLAYIDGDSVPELIYSTGDPVHKQGGSVYTCVNGKLKLIGSFGEFGNFKYAPRKSRIMTCHDHMGYSGYTFLRIKNRKAYATVDFTFADKKLTPYVTKNTYWVNNKKVSKTTYTSKLRRAKKKFKYRDAGCDRGFDTTIANIKKIKTNYKSLIR